jgi:hypothetical protein
MTTPSTPGTTSLPNFRAIRGLGKMLQTAWSRETSADPEHWSPQNPAWGQCAVTALIIQDYMGGELLRCEIRGTSHYWNRLPSGEEVDLTIDQFGTNARRSPSVSRSRDYVLSVPSTAHRYGVLRSRLPT